MENWRIYGKKADFNGIGEKFHIDPVVARVIRNRDIITEEELLMYFSEDTSKLHSPWLLKDMDKAIDIITAGIAEKKNIRIIGDYDIDGICSIYILLTALKNAGANVDYVVPDRIADGYGINENLIKSAFESGVDIIVTCDNGIAAYDAIAYAKSLGMTVIITDHHNVPFREESGSRYYVIPEADAVINPKQELCEYPFKEICGAYVAYKFACCLYEKCRIEGIEEFMQFAAIATVGDIMPLRDENRILVKRGLKDIVHTKNAGLKALLEVNALTDRTITSYDIGFRIGPCLNASGRLETAKYAVDMLLCEDIESARNLAVMLRRFNDDRKTMTESAVCAAVRQVEETSLKNDKVLVIYLPECHESIAGIVAGRIKERLNRPAIVLTDAENGVKGSGRSIEHYNMFEELTKCKELFTKFGGHPMAAGLSLEKKNIEPLRKMLNRNTSLTEEDFVKTVWIDVPMPVSYISEKLIEDLKLLEPFGNGNEKPVFAEKNLFVKSINVTGKNRNVVKLGLINEKGFKIDAVYFGDADIFTQKVREREKYAFTYYPTLNEYRGERSIQIIITGVQ